MTSPSRFGFAVRGYACEEVDALIDRAETALNSADPALRATVRDELRVAKFSVAWRGYRRQEVAMFIEALAELAQPPTHEPRQPGSVR
jgi:DivIVA domain-containing protein